MRVKRARRRINIATAGVTEEKKIGNMTVSALDFLLRSTNLGIIQKALMELGKLNVSSLQCVNLASQVCFGEVNSHCKNTLQFTLILVTLISNKA